MANPADIVWGHINDAMPLNQIQKALSNTASAVDRSATALIPPRPPAPDITPWNQQSIQGRARPAPFDIASIAFGPQDILTPLIVGLPGQADELPSWSYYPWRRDRELRKLARDETIIAGALYSMVARITTLRWALKGGRNQKRHFQEVIANCGGGMGFAVEIGKIVYDLLTQDNGAFIELTGAGPIDGPLFGPVTGFAHMDAARCWRTFNPEYPVLYWNPMTFGAHRIHYSRVVMLSQNPQPEELARNIGYCAVSRAMRAVQLTRDVMIYKHEKVSGGFTRAIGYGSGITPKQFKQSIREVSDEDESVGFTRFRRIPFVLSQQDINMGLLDLASLPDGFDTEKDTTLYVYAIALAFGVDAREFWPATISGATKADADVQHLKARGKGLGELIQMIERVINWRILPESVTFEFDFTDDEADRASAEIKSLKLSNIQRMQQMSLIDQKQAQHLAIADGVLDPSVFDEDINLEVTEDSSPMPAQEIDIPEPPEIPEAPTMTPQGVPINPSGQGKPPLLARSGQGSQATTTNPKTTPARNRQARGPQPGALLERRDITEDWWVEEDEVYDTVDRN